MREIATENNAMIPGSAEKPQTEQEVYSYLSICVAY